jgi:quercetin dioxygenase-like cupin family protein
MSERTVRVSHADARKWIEAVGFGGPESHEVVFEGGYGVRTAIFRTAAGSQIPSHVHTSWAALIILDGRVRMEQDNAEPIEGGAGTVFFVEPGQQHVDIVLEDATSVVVYGDDLEVNYL